MYFLLAKSLIPVIHHAIGYFWGLFLGIINHMHTKIFSATTIGVHAHLVEVEVDLSFGLMNFFIVGLPDTAIKESRQRIQTALKNCGIKLPERKITVNLAPADLRPSFVNN